MSRLEADVEGLGERLLERHGPSQRYLDLVEEKRRLQAELAQCIGGRPSSSWRAIVGGVRWRPRWSASTGSSSVRPIALSGYQAS